MKKLIETVKTEENYEDEVTNASSFYRAMHVVLARYCYRSRPSVCPSVTLMYRGHIGWTSSKLITQIISLGYSQLAATISANLVQREHP